MTQWKIFAMGQVKFLGPGQIELAPEALASKPPEPLSRTEEASQSKCDGKLQGQLQN